jgi:hypothetical protein
VTTPTYIEASGDRRRVVVRQCSEAVGAPPWPQVAGGQGRRRRLAERSRGMPGGGGGGDLLNVTSRREEGG